MVRRGVESIRSNDIGIELLKKWDVALAGGCVGKRIGEVNCCGGEHMEPYLHCSRGLTAAIGRSVGREAATLVCDPFDEELGAIGLEEELLALRRN